VIQLLRYIRYVGPMAQVVIYLLQLMGLLAASLLFAYFLGFSPLGWLFDVLVDFVEALLDAVLL